MSTIGYTVMKLQDAYDVVALSAKRETVLLQGLPAATTKLRALAQTILRDHRPDGAIEDDEAEAFVAMFLAPIEARRSDFITIRTAAIQRFLDARGRALSSGAASQ